MQSLTLIVHVALAVAVIGLVLIQHGKGADAGAAFGSGASSTVFGARGSASFLTRLTTILAALFFATSIILFYLAAHRDRGTGSVTDSLPKAVIESPAEVESDLPSVEGVAPSVNDSTGSDGSSAAESDMPAAEGAPEDTSQGAGTENPEESSVEEPAKE